MRLMIAITILLNTFLGVSQTFELSPSNKADTINFIDATGKKQGKWVLYGKHKPGQCYTPVQVAESGKYQENRKTGEWLEYFCNGNIKNQVNFVNGRQDGKAIVYYENGKLKEEGNWKNNRWVGNYKLYYENGQLQHDFTYSVAGKREGLSTYIHPNGKVAIKGVFKDGKESGLFQEWNEDGKLKAEKNYADGQVDVASIKVYENTAPKIEPVIPNAPKVTAKPEEKEMTANASKSGPLNGQHVLYNKNKQIAKSGLFKDNRLMEGKDYTYNDNGILTKISVYKNGIYVGDAPIEN
jgi:antitoxin component YwqK of YwqJK toxin-antitoxin module